MPMTMLDEETYQAHANDNDCEERGYRAVAGDRLN